MAICLKGCPKMVRIEYVIIAAFGNALFLSVAKGVAVDDIIVSLGVGTVAATVIYLFLNLLARP